MRCPGGSPRRLSSLSACLPQHSLIFCPGSGFKVPRLAVHFCCPLGGGRYAFSLHPPAESW